MKYFRYPDCNVTTYCLGYIVCKGAFTKMALKYKIISRGSKLQTYKTLTYVAETWMLTVAEENALRRFERKVLWKVYGPVMDNGVWR